MRILLSAIYPYAFMLLYLIIPFDDHFRVVPNILMGILVVAFPFIVQKEDFKKLKSLPIAVFLMLFAYLCINSFLSGRWEEDYKIINKVMIAGGLAILYIPVADVNLTAGRVGKINSAIIFSSLAAIIFSVYNFVLITDATGSFALGESPQVVESLLIDRLYLGLLSTFSILISFQAIQKKYHPNNNYYLANIFVNAIFIVLIASKIAVISLFVLLLIRQFYGTRKVLKAIVALGSVTAVIVLFYFLKNENEAQKNPPAIIENSMTYELRAVAWHCANTIIKKEDFIFTGMGFNTTKDKLVSCYDSQISDPNKKQRFIAERYNTHNQFLDFYLSAGFVALLLFLVFIGASFFSVRKQFYPTAMLAILVMYCSIENVFNRQLGAYYVGFILLVLLISAKGMENKNIKNIE